MKNDIEKIKNWHDSMKYGSELTGGGNRDRFAALLNCAKKIQEHIINTFNNAPKVFKK